jgi:membrane protein involved in colicin uptake
VAQSNDGRGGAWLAGGAQREAADAAAVAAATAAAEAAAEAAAGADAAAQAAQAQAAAEAEAAQAQADQQLAAANTAAGKAAAEQEAQFASARAEAALAAQRELAAATEAKVRPAIAPRSTDTHAMRRAQLTHTPISGRLCCPGRRGGGRARGAGGQDGVRSDTGATLRRRARHLLPARAPAPACLPAVVRDGAVGIIRTPACGWDCRTQLNAPLN